MNRVSATLYLLGLLALLGSCAAPTDTSAATSAPAPAEAVQEGQTQALPVTATTSVVADFVRAVGGGRVQVGVLVPAGSDPHGFSPTPASIRSLSGSAALFANGAGLEGWLGQVRGAAANVPVYALTDGLALEHAGESQGHKEGRPEQQHGEEQHGGHEEHRRGYEHGHGHGDTDPHAWWDPELAAGYARAVAGALTELDPAGAAAYQANAEAYAGQIRELGRYGRQRFARIPARARRVATEHDSLGYFARYYGLEVAGSILPGLSTERQPSARDLAELTRAMQAEGVRVVLTGDAVQGRLLDTVARETGAEVVRVYTDALGAAGTGGETYLGALRHNIDAVADALERALEERALEGTAP